MSNLKDAFKYPFSYGFVDFLGSTALTVCSWTGLDYNVDNKERNLYFETFLKFIGAFRTLNNCKLRILIGGLFNVDLKVTQVGKVFPI